MLAGRQGRQQAGNNGNINCRASALGYAPPATAAPPAPAEEEKARPTDAELAVALGLGPPHDVTVGAGAIGVRFKPSSGLGPQVLAVFEHCPCPESFALGACVVAVDGRDARDLTPTELCEHLKARASESARALTLRAPAARADGDGDRGPPPAVDDFAADFEAEVGPLLDGPPVRAPGPAPWGREIPACVDYE